MSNDTPKLLRRLQPYARHLAVAAGVIMAFALGLCVSGGDRSAQPKPENDHDHDHAAEQASVWTCPMHPQIRQNGPGTCPICGMDLVPVDPIGDQIGDQAGGSDRGATMDRITLSERARTMARIRTTEVQIMPQAVREVRLLGRVDYDETRLKSVTAWTEGRIDKLLVSTTGQRIRPGQIIGRLYSPEIYAAQSDLIQAAQQVARLGNGSELARGAAQATQDAARQRLRLLGVPESEITSMEKAKTPSRSVAIRTPFGGTVIERMVSEGNYVSAGMALFRVADLSQVWVQLDAYETDTPLLAVGAQVTLAVTGLTGQRFEGKVAFIDPVVDAKTRTSRVRVQVANPKGVLKPGMFAEATLETGATSTAQSESVRLMIPDTAPLYTGQRSIVYVEVPGKDRPAYEAREVELGPRAGTWYPVLSGLELGDRVVTRGAFVLDADLQIKGGASMMTRDDDQDRRRSAPIENVPEPLARHLAAVVTGYLAVQEALAADDLERARGLSKELLQAVVHASAVVPERLQEHWNDLSHDLDAYARYLAGAGRMAPARKAFEELSAKIIVLLERFGNPTDQPVQVAYCPMAFDGRGATWVQRGDTINNSYFGADMLTCGEFRGEAGSGTHLEPSQTEPREPAPKGHQH
jgi:Cu(I)/Ag(I) efflux system membrane fusion protein